VNVRLDRTWAMKRDREGRITLALDKNFCYRPAGGRCPNVSVTLTKPLVRMVCLSPSRGGMLSVAMVLNAALSECAVR
jgi:hypothetical protein